MGNSSKTVFSVERVTLAYGSRVVVSELSFSLGEGERLVLVGGNGTGKSTVLKALDALLFPLAGSISYDGTALSQRMLADPNFRRRFRGEVGLLFQSVDAMLFNASVADELAFGLRQLGLADVEARVQRAAADFGLTRLLARSPFELSIGEKKRTALAALFALSPRVLLLDEPTANLDPPWTQVLLRLLAERRELATVITTHDALQTKPFGARSVELPSLSVTDEP